MILKLISIPTLGFPSTARRGFTVPTNLKPASASVRFLSEFFGVSFLPIGSQSVDHYMRCWKHLGVSRGFFPHNPTPVRKDGSEF